MKLLFDENLSCRLVDSLADCYAGSCHVRSVGQSLLFGAPPKVVWINIGNCSTATIEQVLRRHVADLEKLEGDSAAVFLILD